MEKLYAGDSGLTIIVDCGRDVAGAVGARLLVRRPDGSETEWPAAPHVIDGQARYLRATTEPGQLDMPGRYLLQACVALGGGQGRGSAAAFVISRPFE